MEINRQLIHNFINENLIKDFPELQPEIEAKIKQKIKIREREVQVKAPVANVEVPKVARVMQVSAGPGFVPRIRTSTRPDTSDATVP